MDEPTLYLRDGASVTQIPLSQLLHMFHAAAEMAEGALSGNPQAVAAADMVARTAQVYGPQRGTASVSMYLLQDAMQHLEQKKQAAAIVVAPAQSVGAAPTQTAPAAADPGAGDAAAPAPGPPCQHPPDIACPNCAASHMEARNAKKRAGARA